MVGSLFLCFYLIPIILAQSSIPAGLSNVLRKSNREQKSWSMPLSPEHPIRKELEKDPGTLLGRIEDFDFAKFQRGEIDLKKNVTRSASRKFSRTKTGIKNKLINVLQTSKKNPSEIFFRKLRTSKRSQCNIEIQMIVSQPGHCVRLRDNTPACQNEEYVAVNQNECS